MSLFKLKFAEYEKYHHTNNTLTTRTCLMLVFEFAMIVLGIKTIQLEKENGELINKNKYLKRQLDQTT